jgi:hypothetical protein
MHAWCICPAVSPLGASSARAESSTHHYITGQMRSNPVLLPIQYNPFAGTNGRIRSPAADTVSHSLWCIILAHYSRALTRCQWCCLLSRSNCANNAMQESNWVSLFPGKRDGRNRLEE